MRTGRPRRWINALCRAARPLHANQRNVQCWAARAHAFGYPCCQSCDTAQCMRYQRSAPRCAAPRSEALVTFHDISRAFPAVDILYISQGNQRCGTMATGYLSRNRQPAHTPNYSPRNQLTYVLPDVLQSSVPCWCYRSVPCCGFQAQQSTAELDDSETAACYN